MRCTAPHQRRGQQPSGTAYRQIHLFIDINSSTHFLFNWYMLSSSYSKEKQISSPPMHPRAARAVHNLHPCMHNRTRHLALAHTSTAISHPWTSDRKLSTTPPRPCQTFPCCSGDLVTSPRGSAREEMRLDYAVWKSWEMMWLTPSRDHVPASIVIRLSAASGMASEYLSSKLYLPSFSFPLHQRKCIPGDHT
jgi:hypothetical protein